jgi:hypothetical protein
VCIESFATSLSEAIQGMNRLPFEMVAQYDEPPPDGTVRHQMDR